MNTYLFRYFLETQFPTVNVSTVFYFSFCPRRLRYTLYTYVYCRGAPACNNTVFNFQMDTKRSGNFWTSLSGGEKCEKIRDEHKEG